MVPDTLDGAAADRHCVCQTAPVERCWLKPLRNGHAWSRRSS